MRSISLKPSVGPHSAFSWGECTAPIETVPGLRGVTNATFGKSTCGAGQREVPLLGDEDNPSKLRLTVCTNLPRAIAMIRVGQSDGNRVGHFVNFRHWKAWVKHFPSTFVVSNIDDSGLGSGRAQAILDSNANVGFDETNCFRYQRWRVHAIAPASGLPVITDPVSIDGTTQPTFNDVPVIELSGANAGTVDGLSISAGDSIIPGLSDQLIRIGGNSPLSTRRK